MLHLWPVAYVRARLNNASHVLVADEEWRGRSLYALMQTDLVPWRGTGGENDKYKVCAGMRGGCRSHALRFLLLGSMTVSSACLLSAHVLFCLRRGLKKKRNCSHWTTIWVMTYLLSCTMLLPRAVEIILLRCAAALLSRSLSLGTRRPPLPSGCSCKTTTT